MNIVRVTLPFGTKMQSQINFICNPIVRNGQGVWPHTFAKGGGYPPGPGWIQNATNMTFLGINSNFLSVEYPSVCFHANLVFWVQICVNTGCSSLLICVNFSVSSLPLHKIVNSWTFSAPNISAFFHGCNAFSVLTFCWSWPVFLRQWFNPMKISLQGQAKASLYNI